jgi:hypothetical protein
MESKLCGLCVSEPSGITERRRRVIEKKEKNSTEKKRNKKQALTRNRRQQRIYHETGCLIQAEGETGLTSS